MDVSFLDDVFSAPGPYATVCADVTHTTENADSELDLRVRALTEQLSEQGAPEPVVDAVRTRLTEGNDGGQAGTLRGRAVVVAGNGTVVLDEVLADVPRRPVARWSAQPELMPVLRQLAGRVPHVVVVADRVGADVSVATRPGRPTEEHQVEGNSFHMQKVKVGGWAHNTYLHTAESRWEENVDRVVADLDRLVEQERPAFVLVAGDVRARQLLTDRAPHRIAELLVTMEEGGRAAGAARAPIAAREVALVAEHEAAEISGAVEQFEAAAAHGLAVSGLGPVVEALRKGQVETLVLAEEPGEETLLLGSEPMVIGVDQGEMSALGAPDAERVPAERALLGAAAAGDARVVVVPRSAMPGDIPVAAVLRFTDASTPQPQRTS